MASVFISYAEADRPWVERYLIDAFDAAGISHIHEAAFELGTTRLSEFQNAVLESEWTVLVLSPAYFVNDITTYVDLMAQHFDTYESIGWRVIPLIIDDVDLSSRPRLGMLTAVDATDPDQWESAVTRICEAIKRPPPPPFSPPPCPYPGMTPFTEDLAEYFFGRDAEVDQLVDNLAVSGFLVVLGPSGSGKSSLVRAGLTKRLRETGLFGGGEWAFEIFRPGPRPADALTAAIGAVDDDAEAAVRRVLDSSEAARLLVVVDQFEEVFTEAAADGDRSLGEFFTALKDLAQVEGCYVVLTLRADFLGELMKTKLWSRLSESDFKLAPMTDEQLRSAIVAPAEKVGVYVEPALVERLLGDAANEPGMLPIVQAAMVRLWDRGLRRRILPLEAYESMVTLPLAAYEGPAPTGLQAAMSNLADGAMRELLPQQRLIAERVFLRLVDFGEGRPDVRRQLSEHDLRATGEPQEELTATLDVLIRHRLLIPDAARGEGESRRIDLAHEALIAGWPRYQRWIADRKAEEQTLRRLLAKVSEWERLGGGAAGLLDEVELREATQWLEGAYARELGADPRLDRFVAASVEEVARRREEEEAARRRELETARALADEQRRRVQVRTRLMFVVLVIAAVAAGAAFVATVQRQRAADRERLASSRELAAQALATVQQRPDLAMLLSLESWRVANTLEARDALLAVTANTYARAYLHDHTDAVRAVAAAESGGRFVTAGTEGRAIVRDGMAGGVVTTLTHDAGLISVDMSDDGQTVAAGGEDGRAIVWDVSAVPSEQLPRHFGHGGNAVRGAALSPSGEVLATGASNVLTVWTVGTGAKTELTAHGDAITAVAFNRDGTLLASSDVAGQVRVWAVDLAAAVPLQLVAVFGHDAAVRALAFDPTSKVVATGGDDHRVRLWDITSGDLLSTLTGHAARVHTVDVSPNGERVVSGSDDESVIVWDATVGVAEIRLDGHTQPVRAAVFLDDRTIVSGGSDHATIVWGVSSVMDTENALRGHDLSVRDVALSRDGSLVASAGEEGRVIVWGYPSGRPLHVLEHEELVQAVAFHPSGGELTTAGDDGTVTMWALGDEPRSAPVPAGHSSIVWGVAYSADGNEIATVGQDGRVVLRDLVTGEQSVLAEGPPKRSVAFGSDGTHLAWGGAEGRVVVWDLGVGEEAATFMANGDEVWAVSLDPTGNQIAAAGNSGLVLVWDIGSGELDHRLAGHTDVLRSVAFGPSGDVLASAGQDGTIVLWDLETGEPTSRLRGHVGRVWTVAFHRADGGVVSGGSDGTVRIWNPGPAAAMKAACRIANRNLTQAEWDQFVDPGSTYRRHCADLAAGSGAPADAPAAEYP